jgi:lysophospholipase L1-like esterase
MKNIVCGFLFLSAFRVIAAQNAPPPTVTEARKPGTEIRIELIGDSTQTDNAGYGRGFCANLKKGVECINFAKGGTSTKTFRRDGIWDKALASKPDYMLIQFGHNDLVAGEPNDRQVPLPDYKVNLRTFILEARAANIRPVLITPLTRRFFGNDGKIHSDLTAYVAAMMDIAHEMQVPLIDLQKESIAYLESIGPDQGNKLGITKKAADGSTELDKTHLNWAGSYVFGRMVAEDLGKVVPQLAAYVKQSPATLPAEGKLAMRVIEQSPFKIVLTEDSTVAKEGGWGPGFCATLTSNVTCVDLALNGRSTKSFLDEGAWKKALDQKGQYYFIQFGHNDQKPDPARHTDPNTTYAANLHQMIKDVRAIGGIPILVTPLSRRNFVNGRPDPNDGLSEYANAARNVASEDRVTVVDLYNLSQKYLSTLTQKQADELNMVGHQDAKAENGSEAKPDRTHLNQAGKSIFGRMVADNVVRSEVELGPNVIGLPVGASTDVPKQVAPANSQKVSDSH